MMGKPRILFVEGPSTCQVWGTSFGASISGNSLRIKALKSTRAQTKQGLSLSAMICKKVEDTWLNHPSLTALLKAVLSIPWLQISGYDRLSWGHWLSDTGRNSIITSQNLYITAL